MKFPGFPKLLDHDDGPSPGLDVGMLDAMNRLLGQSDLMRKLTLTETQHRSCGTNISGNRRARYA
jgi:hypothetical protein